MFRQLGIYAANGQHYTPEDQEQLMHYREAKDGHMLQEGINEAGAMSVGQHWQPVIQPITYQ